MEFKSPHPIKKPTAKSTRSPRRPLRWVPKGSQKHPKPTNNSINIKDERTIIAFFLCDGSHVLPTTADIPVVNWTFKIPYIIAFWNRIHFKRKIGDINWLSDLVSCYLVGDKEYVEGRKAAFRKERNQTDVRGPHPRVHAHRRGD